jgi:plasmid stabilization system protein ParE
MAGSGSPHSPETQNAASPVKPVILTPIADADIERVAVWYEERKEGLGAEFTRRVRETLERIGEIPSATPKR